VHFAVCLRGRPVETQNDIATRCHIEGECGVGRGVLDEPGAGIARGQVYITRHDRPIALLSDGGFAAGYHFNERRGELLALRARRREHQRIERQQVESI
jgi:hypothetical protein